MASKSSSFITILQITQAYQPYFYQTSLAAKIWMVEAFTSSSELQCQIWQAIAYFFVLIRLCFGLDRWVLLWTSHLPHLQFSNAMSENWMLFGRSPQPPSLSSTSKNCSILLDAALSPYSPSKPPFSSHPRLNFERRILEQVSCCGRSCWLGRPHHPNSKSKVLGPDP